MCTSRSSAPTMSVPAGVDRQRGLLAAEHEIAAHARCQVEHHVDVGRAHALDDLAVQLGVARAAAGRRIAHVDVRDRGAGACRLDRGRRRSRRASPARGRCDPVVAPAPVTAHVMKASHCMGRESSHSARGGTRSALSVRTTKGPPRRALLTRVRSCQNDHDRE